MAQKKWNFVGELCENNKQVITDATIEIAAEDVTEPSGTATVQDGTMAINLTIPKPEAATIGLTGPTGPVGPTGPKGADGLQGIQGEVGPTGPQGIQGVQGLQGIQGIQGEVGPTGPTGPIGAIGPTGPQGDTGAKGEKGDKGDPGKDGTDATVTSDNIKNALGYTPANPDDVQKMIDETFDSIVNGNEVLY